MAPRVPFYSLTILWLLEFRIFHHASVGPGQTRRRRGSLIRVKVASLIRVKAASLIRVKAASLIRVRPLVLSESRPLVLSESRPLVLSESRPLVLSESRPLVLSESRSLVLSESRPLVATGPKGVGMDAAEEPCTPSLPASRARNGQLEVAGHQGTPPNRARGRTAGEADSWRSSYPSHGR